ncbi:Rrf2 family transcriptional regulator [Bacillus sp. FJAT-42376]|uniref:RrF2 family transcriptional regulator n=1 Tax=Bacillus sp. FJAT-42376 TaxID=2014076 RepID=UPI000F50BCFE|nr:Rrf2 family transcriptional regulator [Bacillus sp. FJAT-42376]AZB42112.1 Rrf2 family transcriptional regulator [Bacillus sp. FJAT-42376]
MQMKTGVEQAVYAILMLTFLPEKAVLPGEVISGQLGGSPTYFQKLLRKLVSADLIASVPGKKGGFRLKRKPEDIAIYDVYMAIEGKQSLYSSTGIFHDMLNIQDKEIDLLSNLMGEAESSWKSILNRETIGSLNEEIHKKCPKESIVNLRAAIHEKMVV